MTRLAYPLAAVAIALSVPGAVLTTWVGWTGWADLPFGLAFSLLGVLSAVTGAAVASRLPTNAIGWIILGLGLGVGLLLSLGAYAEIGVVTEAGPLPGQLVVAWLADVLGIPLFFGLTGYLLMLFPTGRLLTPRWSWFAWFFGVVTGVATLSYGLLPGSIGPGVANPFAVEGRARETVRLVADVTDWMALPAMLLCAAALALRLRRARGIERQQLKWFTYSATVAGVGLGLTIVTPGPVGDLAFFAGLSGVVLLPVTAGIAVLRFRLYDIDLVIKRTLVYVTLTATLVAAYLLLVLLLQTLLGRVAGDSDLAIAASTLAVAALFGPLRAAIQSVVDRRFFRSRYDAAHTLEGFSGRLRDELDLAQLTGDLRAVVHDTMQPTHVSLWLREAPGSQNVAVTIPGRPPARKVTP
jgi:hypothetical protein